MTTRFTSATGSTATQRARMACTQWLCTLVATAALSLGAMQAMARPPAAHTPRPQAGAGYTMPSTEVFDLTSEGGEVYRIFVSFPSGGKAPKDGYPVLYVLDGNAYFGSFAAARWIQEFQPVGQSIIVGVGYPGDAAWDVRRMNDYTQPLLDPPPKQWRELAKYKSGARKPFLDFLTGKLRTEIDRRYKVDDSRNALFGHSFGGLFALYTLYERPDAFNAIVAASPSSEWNEQGILKEERAFSERLTSGRIGTTSKLMVVVSDQDKDDDPEPARALVDRLDRLSGYGMRVRLHRYTDEAHVTVPARSATDVLRFAFEIR